MKLFKLILVIFLLIYFNKGYATHLRAGEITYQRLPGSGNTYIITVTTYSNTCNTFKDDDSVSVNFGDGSQTKMFPRIMKADVANCIRWNVYQGTHSFTQGRDFIISVEEPNRMAHIGNINNPNGISCGSPCSKITNEDSQNILFFLESMLNTDVPSYCGLFNNSPVLLQKPIDQANVNKIFKHNPGAYDIDGDSLSYEMVVPLMGTNIPVPLYLYPTAICPRSDNNLTLNPVTGEIVWDAPKKAGIYNIAFRIHEWRKCIDGVAHEVGWIMRDMQIIVEECEQNDPPVIAPFNDTCIIAGTFLYKIISASDPNNGQTITLSADGGPFIVTKSPATFSSNPTINNVQGEYNWSTVCDHIRKDPYQVIFKAEDNYRNPSSLVDLKTWLITVVGPPPQNLRDTVIGNDIRLDWDSLYACYSGATKKFKGFSIWRREGCQPDLIDTCNNNLSLLGYEKIADFVQNYFYIDHDVERGRQYSYRVVAIFADGTSLNPYNQVSGLPSQQVCAQLKIDVPLITNVSVRKTDLADGIIYLAWLSPQTDTANLDTLTFRPPYRYEIFRDTGYGFVPNNFQQIKTFTAPSSFTQLKNFSSVIDSFLNTEQNSYCYRIDFYSQNIFIGSSIASSLYLSISPNDMRLQLKWDFKVPWDNFAYTVYKYDSNLMRYDSIAFTNIQVYTDTGLKNDTQYCYYVKSWGIYSALQIPDTFLNDSQEKCASPKDTIPPCPPVLTVRNHCEISTAADWDPESYPNELSWTHPNSFCNDKDAIKFYIYYSSTESGELTKIDSTIEIKYFHNKLKGTLAGCYAITAIDSYYNESIFSNKICVDNCPIYELPNVFTPNGDDSNDFFTPIIPYGRRFIDHIDFKVYNRWGEVVFRTEDPGIGWDGKEYKSGKDLAEGVYFYSCYIFEIRLKDIEKRKLKPGYIHLIRTK